MDDQELFGPRHSIRLRGFAYAQEGAYFLTICAYNRRCLFGNVKDSRVELTALGKIVDECWAAIPLHFPHTGVPSHVVMPNHLHGIVLLYSDPRRNGKRPEAFQKPVAGSVPTIARAFKAAVTREARRYGLEPPHDLWQHNYFERVLRNGQECTNAMRYILENPVRWQFDRENPEWFATAHPPKS